MDLRLQGDDFILQCRALCCEMLELTVNGSLDKDFGLFMNSPGLKVYRLYNLEFGWLCLFRFGTLRSLRPMPLHSAPDVLKCVRILIGVVAIPIFEVSNGFQSKYIRSDVSQDLRMITREFQLVDESDLSRLCLKGR